MSQPVIRFQSVSRSFGKFTAVDTVSFDVPAGQTVGFVGPNGAGKSTTINMLMGFIRTSRGSVELFGERVQPQRAWQQHGRIGFATGDLELPGNLNGQQYLAFLARQYRTVSDVRLHELIARFSPELGKPMRELSRGNRQKIALIAAFFHRPKLVVLDEPSSGLDPLMQEVFLDIISEERERGTTIFMSSHILSEVASVTDRVLFMKRGQVIRDSATRELGKSAQKHVYIRARKLPKNLPAGALQRGKAGRGEVRFFMPGDNYAQLIAWLDKVKDIQDLEIGSDDIDSLFFDLYRDEDREAGR